MCVSVCMKVNGVHVCPLCVNSVCVTPREGVCVGGVTSTQVCCVCMSE